MSPKTFCPHAIITSTIWVVIGCAKICFSEIVHVYNYIGIYIRDIQYILTSTLNREKASLFEWDTVGSCIVK